MFYSLKDTNKNSEVKKIREKKTNKQHSSRLLEKATCLTQVRGRLHTLVIVRDLSREISTQAAHRSHLSTRRVLVVDFLCAKKSLVLTQICSTLLCTE